MLPHLPDPDQCSLVRAASVLASASAACLQTRPQEPPARTPRSHSSYSAFPLLPPAPPCGAGATTAAGAPADGGRRAAAAGAEGVVGLLGAEVWDTFWSSHRAPGAVLGARVRCAGVGDADSAATERQVASRQPTRGAKVWRFCLWIPLCDCRCPLASGPPAPKHPIALGLSLCWLALMSSPCLQVAPRGLRPVNRRRSGRPVAAHLSRLVPAAASSLPAPAPRCMTRNLQPPVMPASFGSSVSCVLRHHSRMGLEQGVPRTAQRVPASREGWHCLSALQICGPSRLFPYF